MAISAECNEADMLDFRDIFAWQAPIQYPSVNGTVPTSILLLALLGCQGSGQIAIFPLFWPSSPDNTVNSVLIPVPTQQFTEICP